MGAVLDGRMASCERSGGAQGGRERNLRVSGEIKGEAKKGAENGRA
jgi:hypothetical protein